MKNPLDSVSGITDKVINLVFIIVLLGVAIYFINSWIKDLKEQGEKDDAVELSGETALQNTGLQEVIGSATTQTEIQKMKNALKNFDVKPIADMIYNAKGVVDDDEPAVMLAFGMVKNKTQLAFLTKYFELLYHVNLFQYLQSFLDYAELSQINSLVQKLPKY